MNRINASLMAMLFPCLPARDVQSSNATVICSGRMMQAGQPQAWELAEHHALVEQQQPVAGRHASAEARQAVMKSILPGASRIAGR